MRAEGRVIQLEAELAEQRAENAVPGVENTQLRQQMEQVLARLAEVEGRLAKDSQNNSKPPSSDGLAHVPRSQRKASGKKTGGQLGHPAGRQMSEESFPAGVEAPTHYGLNVRALAVYLHRYQLVPVGRTCEMLEDLYDCRVSEGTLTAWVQQAAERLAPTVAQLADRLSESRLRYADETNVRMGGKLHWLHVNSTRWLTYLAWHPKRGKQALEANSI